MRQQILLKRSIIVTPLTCRWAVCGKYLAPSISRQIILAAGGKHALEDSKRDATLKVAENGRALMQVPRYMARACPSEAFLRSIFWQCKSLSALGLLFSSNSGTVQQLAGTYARGTSCQTKKHNVAHNLHVLHRLFSKFCVFFFCWLQWLYMISGFGTRHFSAVPSHCPNLSHPVQHCPTLNFQEVLSPI